MNNRKNKNSDMSFSIIDYVQDPELYAKAFGIPPELLNDQKNKEPIAGSEPAGGKKEGGCWFGEELGCLGVVALVILAVIEYVRWRMWEDE